MRCAELAKTARSFTQYWTHGNATCPSLVKLREYLHKIYYPAVVEKGPFGKLLCKHSIGSLGIAIPRLSSRIDPLYSRHSWESSGNAKRTNERTNVGTKENGQKKKKEKQRKSTLANVPFYGFTSLRGIPREKFLPRLVHPAVSPVTINGIRLVILRMTADIPVHSIDNE